MGMQIKASIMACTDVQRLGLSIEMQSGLLLFTVLHLHRNQYEIMPVGSDCSFCVVVELKINVINRIQGFLDLLTLVFLFNFKFKIGFPVSELGS